MSEFFPSIKHPRIYAYEDNTQEGWLKVGYTTRSVNERVEEQYPSNLPKGKPYKILLDELAIREDGSYFKDNEIHKRLDNKSIESRGEWYKCDLETVRLSILEEKTRAESSRLRVRDFKMRPEQERAVRVTADYFRSFKEEEGVVPHFLWNAKMRYGKTFAAYQLALEMGWKKILVMTFKPAVADAWREDLETHQDFVDWKFVSNYEEDYKVYELENDTPMVFFGSFQDFLQRDRNTGTIKLRNKWVHLDDWDCVIFDEYHYGAWREKAQDLFDKDTLEQIERRELDAELKEMEMDIPDYFDEKLLLIKTKHYLYLSGTPFRAIGSGEFIEEQIFNWTYSDEQKAKHEWEGGDETNPYLELPRMVMLTYQLPSEVINIALKGEFDEFDLNIFFKAKGEYDNAEFVFKNEVQSWISILRGQYADIIEEGLKEREKARMPFADSRLMGILQHTFWFLPNVASCYAMRNLLQEKQNSFFNEYEIVVAAGRGAGIGANALKPVRKAMGNPLETKSITLSCGKLTTGVTVKPWTGIFMLRNTSSPETYFQSIFRVQSPWVLQNPDGDDPNMVEILKKECYVFDFAPNRALSQIVTYSQRLDVGTDKTPEEKVEEFIRFLPVLSYSGGIEREINAMDILDMVMSGTNATLLAMRWQSALLVNVDNVTLKRLLDNTEALDAIMSIEGFRNINNEIGVIITEAEEIKKARREAAENDEEFSPKQKKELSEREKEVRRIRKEIQDKLIKFASRIPIFMYLTDYREYTLRDVITKVEPELFKKVTGLSKEDFSLLEGIGLFNSEKMNDAVFKFKRYEDSSLEYTGLSKQDNATRVGGYDTSKTHEEYKQIRIEGGSKQIDA